MNNIDGLTAEQERLFESVFRSIFKEDFPGYKGDVTRL